MRRSEGPAFYLTLLAAGGMLACVLMASTCRGQAFTAPGGMYRVENGQAVLNAGGGCANGTCPAPQPWQMAPPIERPQGPNEPWRPQAPQAVLNQGVPAGFHKECGPNGCRLVPDDPSPQQLQVAPPLTRGTFSTKNFSVTSPSAALSQRVAEAAERARLDHAVGWLGTALPDWQHPAIVTVKVANNDGGGASSFAFTDSGTKGFSGSWQGTPDKLVTDVAPHEVMHMVMATHFGKPIPRWIDEGMAQTVESKASKTNTWGSLSQCLKSGRGIPFRQIVAMKDYPGDFSSFYSQGHWMCEFLAIKAGHRSLVELVQAYFDSGNWDAAFREVYGYSGLDEFAQNWQDWVRGGAPVTAQRVAYQNQMGVYVDGQWSVRPWRLIPYRAAVDARMAKLGQQNAQLATMIQQRNSEPPVVFQGSNQPPTDLAPVWQAIEQNRAGLQAVDGRVTNAIDKVEKFAGDYSKELPGLQEKIKQARDEAAVAGSAATDAAKKVDQATDEDNPKGIVGRLKARIEDRVGGILGEVSWLKYGGLGLVAAVIFLFVRKDIKDRKETGDPLLIEKLVDRLGSVSERTKNTVDDRVIERLERRIESLADRVAAKPPVNPT